MKSAAAAGGKIQAFDDEEDFSYQNDGITPYYDICYDAKLRQQNSHKDDAAPFFEHVVDKHSRQRLPYTRIGKARADHGEPRRDRERRERRPADRRPSRSSSSSVSSSSSDSGSSSPQRHRPAKPHSKGRSRSRKRSMRGGLFTERREEITRGNINSCLHGASSASSQPRQRAEYKKHDLTPTAGGSSLATGSVEVPDWLQDLVESAPIPRYGNRHFKASQVQIRCLLGKGGETVQSIMRWTGSQIVITSSPNAFEGDVTVSGNVEPAFKMISDILAAKGCPLVTTSSGEVRSPLEANPPGLIEVPLELVGSLIGRKGAYLHDIQSQVGGEVIIQKLPYTSPRGNQWVQVAGDNWQKALELVLSRLGGFKVGRMGMSSFKAAAPGHVHGACHGAHVGCSR